MSENTSLTLQLRKIGRKLRSQQSGATPARRALDESAVRAAYARWAPVYDMVFRAPLYWGRNAAVKCLNRLEAGQVLEAGVGTGMSLPQYAPHLKVTGIDLSEEMLERARVRARDLPQVQELLAMDAGNLAFPDDHFDAVVAMYVMTVVPDPAKVLRELERVTRPGGMVLLVNHFSAESGLRAKVEQALKPFADRLGWNPDFPKSRVLRTTELELVREKAISPFGLFTMMQFRKPAGHSDTDRSDKSHTGEA